MDSYRNPSSRWRRTRASRGPWRRRWRVAADGARVATAVAEVGTRWASPATHNPSMFGACPGTLQKCRIPCRERPPQRSPLRRALISHGLPTQRETASVPYEHQSFHSSPAGMFDLSSVSTERCAANTDSSRYKKYRYRTPHSRRARSASTQGVALPLA